MPKIRVDGSYAATLEGKKVQSCPDNVRPVLPSRSRNNILPDKTGRPSALVVDVAPGELSPQLVKNCAGHKYNGDNKKFLFQWTDTNQKANSGPRM